MSPGQSGSTANILPLHLGNVLELQGALSALTEGACAGSGLLPAILWGVHVTQAGLGDTRAPLAWRCSTQRSMGHTLRSVISVVFCYKFMVPCSHELSFL